MIRSPATSIRSLTSSGTPASRPRTPAARPRERALAVRDHDRVEVRVAGDPLERLLDHGDGVELAGVDELGDLGARGPASRRGSRVSDALGVRASGSVISSISAGPPHVRARCKRVRELGGVLDPLAVGAVGAGEAGEVGVGEVGGDHARGEAPLLVHADRPVGAVVDDDHEDRQPLLDRGGELHPAHLEVAVARERDDLALGVHELRRQRRRHAVAHRAALRPELRAEAPPLVEARDPAGEVAGAVGEHGVVAAARRAGRRPPRPCRRRRRAPRRARSTPRSPRARPRSTPPSARRRRRGAAAANSATPLEHRERRLVDAPELGRVGVDVHERLRRDRRRGQRVALRLDLGQPRPDRHQQVAVADPLRERRVEPDADVAGVARARVVDDVLAAERRAHRQPARERPARERLRRVVVPRPAADEHERPLRPPRAARRAPRSPPATAPAAAAR